MSNLVKTDELRALLEKATPRPWTYTLSSVEDGLKVTSPSLAEIDSVIGGCGCCGSPWCSSNDASLLVAAVNNLPALLDVVEAARGVLAVGGPQQRALLDAALKRMEEPE